MYRYLYLILFFAVISSCSGKKSVVYLQNIKKGDSFDINFTDYTIKVDDILKIELKADNPEAILGFKNNSNQVLFSNRESILFNSFQVDTNGDIDFYPLGKISVVNLKITEIKELLINRLIAEEILNDLSVDIKIVNSHFIVLGEVNVPGKYNFLKNNLNLLEALGMAGDLTINGKRDDIVIIRDSGKDEKSVFSVDITRSDFISSQYFQIFSGDIIIVNPNSNRVKNAGIIGNSGTLLSLLSFILSSIIVISN